MIGSMGILRTLLALSVVLIHTYGQVFVSGQDAVQLFYVISGFLISYVLLEAKSYPDLKLFFLNRYLRLYPIYILVAALVLCTYWIVGGVWYVDISFLRQLPTSADLVLLLSNLFIFGQDWVMFMAADQGHLSFTEDFSKSALPLAKGLLVPQAWTLGLELTFYLVAPFVLTRKNLIVFLLVGSVLLRLYLINIGIGYQDPWVYRFFPTELALFLGGALAHQILLPYYRKVLKEKLQQYSKIITYTLIVFTLIYAQISLDTTFKKILLYSGFIFLLPFIFLFQDQNKVDKWIGELSYPIYINHMLVMFWVAYAAEQLALPVNNIYYPIVVIVFSVLFAIILNMIVQSWVEKIRTTIKAKHTFR